MDPLIFITVIGLVYLGYWLSTRKAKHRVKMPLTPAEETVVPQRHLSPPIAEPPLPPRCPYCGADFSARKPPRRLSKFKCTACSKTVQVNPYQFIYPTPYLTEIQEGYAGFLWQLDHWVFTIGSKQDYIAMRENLRQKFSAEPGVGDIIWGLMSLSMLKTCKDQWERSDLRRLMESFRKFEGRGRAKGKNVPQAE